MGMKYSMGNLGDAEIGKFLHEDLPFIAPEIDNPDELLLVAVEDWTPADLDFLADSLPNEEHMALILNLNEVEAAEDEEWLHQAITIIENMGFKDVTKDVGYETRMAFVK